MVNHIRHFREKKGLTQKQLADMLGASQSMISCWEQGLNLPSIDVGFRLCKILGQDIDTVFKIES